MLSNFKAILYNERSANKRLKVASVAMACDRQSDINRTHIAATIDAIMQVHPDVELIFFGEMTLGWYNPGSMPEYHRRIAEPIPGETTLILSSLALSYGIYLCFGISEVKGKALHNAQVLLNPQGEIQAVHRKRNLKQAEIKAGYQPGSLRVTTTSIKDINTGMVICSDTASPQTIWELMTSRIDLILLSLADDDKDDFVSKLNARMYDAWVVTANRHGQEAKHFWPGLIVVSDPLGNLCIVEQGREQYLVHELRIADTQSWVKTLIRNIWVKPPVVIHFLRNWRRIKAYM